MYAIDICVICLFHNRFCRFLYEQLLKTWPTAMVSMQELSSPIWRNSWVGSLHATAVMPRYGDSMHCCMVMAAAQTQRTMKRSVSQKVPLQHVYSCPPALGNITCYKIAHQSTVWACWTSIASHRTQWFKDLISIKLPDWWLLCKFGEFYCVYVLFKLGFMMI